VIRKRKASKPTEFGKLVMLREAENQIIIDYEVFARRPGDMDLLIPAIDVHQAKLGRVPRLVAADAGFYSAKNEAAAKAKGVKRVCIPNRSSKSAARKREQKKRWFRNGQRWRTGCEGRISVSKRRHGLNRCRYRGDDGMQRWVGLGVIADNLINVGLAIGKHQPNSYCPLPRIILHEPRQLSLAGFTALPPIDVASNRSRVSLRLEFCAGK
jgi:IS5 family transposase